MSLPREAVDALPELAGRLCFPRVDGGGAPLGALWALGISGDLPLAVMPAGDAEKLSAAIARHALLRAAGVRAELASSPRTAAITAGRAMRRSCAPSPRAPSKGCSARAGAYS